MVETRREAYGEKRREEEKKWVVVRDTTGRGNRIYHRF
jgi:hypothetical protein